MPIADALAHILGHLTDVILHYAPFASLPDASQQAELRRVEAVHQMRVAVRRSLSAASIFRTALPPETLEPLRASLKTLASALAHTRDWDVFVGETAPMVAEALPEDERLRRPADIERRRLSLPPATDGRLHVDRHEMVVVPADHECRGHDSHERECCSRGEPGAARRRRSSPGAGAWEVSAGGLVQDVAVRGKTFLNGVHVVGPPRGAGEGWSWRDAAGSVRLPW